MAQRQLKGACLAFLLYHVPSTQAFNTVQKYDSFLSPKIRTTPHYNSRNGASISAFEPNPCPPTTASRQRLELLELRSSKNEDNDSLADDPLFSWGSILAIVGSQSFLVVLAILAANFLHVPNYGLGPGFVLDETSLQYGILSTLPLFGLAYILDLAEDSIPQLQDVTKATQRSVLALMGGTRKPLIALGISALMGTAAGVGEEMLFRGILQSKLSESFGDGVALSSSAVIFGLLHAVTPLYAALAFVASLFFGELYLSSHNLAVPIICHGLYDIGALLYAHYVVTDMAEDEQMAIVTWVGPNETPVE